MTRLLRIEAPRAPLNGGVRLPPSKSIANRALVCAALAGDPALVGNAGASDDTLRLKAGLEVRAGAIDCGMGGTTLRFLLAWAAAQVGREVHLEAHPRLLQRPHDDLVEVLRSLGADIQRTTSGYHVRGRHLSGGHVTLDAPLSSQYISALMLTAPLMREGLHLTWTGQRLSEPYVEMTARVMRAFGSQVRIEGREIHVSPGRPLRAPFHVAPDWSASAFWAEAVAAVSGSGILLSGLVRDGLQGDEAVVDLWSPFVVVRTRMDGILFTHRHGVPDAPGEVDLTATPDLFPALALTYALRDVPARFTGLHNLAMKESDRLTVVADLLRRGGVSVTEDAAAMTISGRWIGEPGMRIDPVGDHRIAMAAAPLAAACGGLLLSDPEVVGKSYPQFWEDLARAGFGVAEEDVQEAH